MLDHLSYEEFLKLSKTGKRIGVYQKILSDCITPIGALQALSCGAGECALLESAEKHQEAGRYTFLGLDTIACFQAKNGVSEIFKQDRSVSKTGDPLKHLQELREEMHIEEDPHLPHLAGGAIGFLSYDAVRYFEKIPDRHADIMEMPDIFFQFFRTLLVFDHFETTLTLCVIAEEGLDPSSAYKKAFETIQELLQKLLHPTFTPKFLKKTAEQKEVEPDVDDATFCKMVERAQEHIKKGDVFQVVLSRSFKMPVHALPLDIYRALRIVSPSPFMFFIHNKHFSIIGASPERLVRLKNSTLEAMPIAGTRPLKGGELDLLMEQELLQDAKEEAEHMMLVDLGRNDLGAVSEIGTVKVVVLKKVQRFSHVMHLVSLIQSTLKKGLTFQDVLKATFPAGTLSGAPKIRAMQLIDELEQTRRGVYGGAICSIDNLGNMDSCIAIRMAVVKEGIATVRTGAGIVLDSDPMKEADETRHKARGMLQALKMAGENIL